MSSFTPGPWKVLDHTKEPPTQEILCIAETGFALECEPFESISDVDRANANIMAAAPDLLEALEEIVEDYDEYPMGFYRDVIEKAQAAIAKARGQ